MTNAEISQLSAALEALEALGSRLSAIEGKLATLSAEVSKLMDRAIEPVVGTAANHLARGDKLLVLAALNGRKVAPEEMPD